LKHFQLRVYLIRKFC